MVKMWRFEEFVKLRRGFRWQQCVCAITLLAACLTYIPPHRAPRTHSGWRWCGSVWVEHSYLFVCLLVYQASYKKMGYGSIMGSPWSKKITSKLCSLIRFYEKFTVRTVDLKRPKDDNRSKHLLYCRLSSSHSQYIVAYLEKKQILELWQKLYDVISFDVAWHDMTHVQAPTRLGTIIKKTTIATTTTLPSGCWHFAGWDLGTTLAANCCELVWV